MEDLARRAWVTAVVGLFACPPLLHLYSLYLLARLGMMPGALSPVGKRQAYGAFAIDTVALFFAALLVRGILEILPWREE
jgi:hypothetical protein